MTVYKFLGLTVLGVFGLFAVGVVWGSTNVSEFLPFVERLIRNFLLGVQDAFLFGIVLHLFVLLCILLSETVFKIFRCDD